MGTVTPTARENTCFDHTSGSIKDVWEDRFADLRCCLAFTVSIVAGSAKTENDDKTLIQQDRVGAF